VGPRDRSIRIRQFIIDQVRAHPADVATVAAKRFRVTSQAIQRHLNELLENGSLSASGRTRARRYKLAPLAEFSVAVDIEPGLEEHVVWDQCVGSKLDEKIPQNVVTIANYGFTEMLNNVIDHSESATAKVSCLYTAESLTLRVSDKGVGIFRKIMEAMKLPDELAAISELAKGKLTTDPARHSGEGVFFTSRTFDYFSLLSGTLFFLHSTPDDDWLIEDAKDPWVGTAVRMSISINSQRFLTDIFNIYADPEKHDHAFSKTHVPVALMQYGQDGLISRSQAKRLLTRFDKFKEVILDFHGVDFIGQAFADEVFRVFASAHPEVQIIPIKANASITGMIAYVTAPKTLLGQRHMEF
jgi:anti-sigma regulatory factor (Ser/Thr protein kinase)